MKGQVNIWIAFCYLLTIRYCLDAYRGEKEVYVRAGNNATLPCTAAGNAEVVGRLEWWKEYKKIVELREDRRTVWEAEPHVSLLQDSYALYLQPVIYEDSGEYRCVVDGRRNNDGTVRLFVQDVPDPPGMPLIMSFTSRSVNLSWAPSIDTHYSPIVHYVVHVRVGEKGEWDLFNGIVTGDNQTNYQVIGLQPYTVYSFRVLAVNSIGESQPSKESYYMVTLREVPDGKPTIIGAHNTSSSTIRIQWAPPPRHSIHGEFLGYKISYRPRDRPEEKTIILRDPSARQYTFRNLETFTQYLVSVQVFNPAGQGPAATVAVMTDEGHPTKPRNITGILITDNSLRIRWEEPESPNGVIQGYRIYVLHVNQNFTDVHKVLNPQPVMEYLIQNLKPYTVYKIIVKAFTGKYEGDPSNTLEIRTDVQGPSAPYIVNLTCQSLDTLFLQWERPHTVFNRIDYYFVYYRSEKSWKFEEITMASTHDKPDHAVLIPNLTANAMYEVKVRGATRSIVEQNKLYKGPFSESRKVLLQSYTAPYEEVGISAGLIAGIVCVSFALLLAIISFILWRKYFQAAYYYLDDPPGNRISPPLSETFGKKPIFFKIYFLNKILTVKFTTDESEYASIPVHQWAKHVSNLHADGDIGFAKEYEAIQQSSDLDLSAEHSQMAENKSKNRYVNIVAYDHTRVSLKPLPGQKKSDYINANYIDGYGKSRAYIGTQGPLPCTFDDYWRMVWEQRVFVIVMITNLMERGRRKCDMYWPKEGVETYGIVQVKLVREVTMATYTVRTFLVRNVKIKKKTAAERTVRQYHYTNWPDHGVPEHPLPVLSFVCKSSAANPPDAGPIIVHCSAGVGRTGTYIVLDAMLQQIKHRRSVNVFGFLKHIRRQRNFLVQTEEQYVFIHDALLEAIDSGQTELKREDLPARLRLSDDDADEKGLRPALENQFELVTTFRARDFQTASAYKPCNKMKNRLPNLVPVESQRVHIVAKPGVEGSDYINASFLPGFDKLREFIITQHPLRETVADFWQMVWDHNSQTVVVLSYVDEKEYPCFWPESEEYDYGSFKVKTTEESAQGNVATHDFVIQSTQDDYEVTCRIIRCPGWPESCSPVSSVFDLVHVVQEWHLEYQNGPIIVVDRFGGTEAAKFCCLTTIRKQLERENCVDVYMYSKLYHMRRPGIWQTQEDYVFFYRALESLFPASAAGEGTVANGHVNTNGHATKTAPSSKEETAA
ncbi:tyrosine-protein phosphatase 99A-like isoform X2 [Centruroides sculpturatus]|uniref:tyrosine-protein phosphatase 99A-like isoform X2 n=1 Tax=Centruroides sculpturatus TaxID=218467 RepID=UPI000C6CB428|nr:tyrosine-protein phosphatase 99A-like isoform X2 [Centruroides sculpturatus]